LCTLVSISFEFKVLHKRKKKVIFKRNLRLCDESIGTIFNYRYIHAIMLI